MPGLNDRLTPLVLLAPAAVLGVVAWLLPSLPDADYWTRFPARYLLADDRWRGFWEMLWVSDNGHRIPLAHLNYLVNFHWFAGSNYGLFAMTGLFAVATAGFLVGALRTVRGVARAGDVPLVFALVLSPAAIFHWVSPMSGAHWLFADALWAAALLALARYAVNLRIGDAVLACGLAILAAFAFTTGLVALALISCGIVLVAPRSRRMVLALLAVNGVFYLAYFTFVFDLGGKTLEGPDLVRAVAFFLSAAGNHFSARPIGIIPATIAGTVLIVAWLLLLGRLAAGAMGASRRRVAIVIGILGAYALINLALIAIARHSMELTVSLTTRYGNIATLLLLAAIVGWIEFESGLRRRWMCWISIAALVGVGYLKGVAELAVYHYGYLQRAPVDRLAVMLDLPEVPGADSYVHFPADPALVEALRRHGHVPFSDFDRPMSLGTRLPGRPGIPIDPEASMPVRNGWTRIEFLAPDLPDEVDLVDVDTGRVAGAAVRVGNRYIGYARPGTAGLSAREPVLQ
ncbi:MAG: hypothetical protein QNJ40_21130 [Xanthomonadales bacterium]|nr:hypothetical protein [Xanthomonadales bacterium]